MMVFHPWTPASGPESIFFDIPMKGIEQSKEIIPSMNLARIAERLVGASVPPRITKVESIGQVPPGQGPEISVWIVDGNYVRTHIDEEFTNFGHCFFYKFIPEDEFWIDQEAVPNEYDFFVVSMMTSYDLTRSGMEPDLAIEEANKVEERCRREKGDIEKVRDPDWGHYDPEKVHKRRWKTLENGVVVWIVDGRLIRSAFNIEFTEGGHDKVYEFVPDNEVWIDDDLTFKERRLVLLHELHERNLMESGWPYSRAHADSSRIESLCRKNPASIHNLLMKEGWA